jgi:hypothetical protein
MQQVSQSDFIEWRSNPTTKAFHAAVIDYIEQVKDSLSVSAGLDANEDNYKRGAIAAMRDVLQFRIDDLQEAVDGN